MKSLRLRLEQLLNGVTITNRSTGNKEMNYNSAKVTESVTQFITGAIADAEPGTYYDIDITVTKRALKKPSES